MVTMDSDSSPDSSVLTVESRDYPGLLRVCAWVLNGLDVVVTSARQAALCVAFACPRCSVLLTFLGCAGCRLETMGELLLQCGVSCSCALSGNSLRLSCSYARNRFWLQHRNGKKLSREAAQLVAERVGDYVSLLIGMQL